MSTEIATLFARIGADVSGLTNGLAQARSSLMSAGQTIGITGAALTVGLTWPLQKMGSAAAKASIDLDEQMRNIQSISRQTDGEIAALSDTFVTMSTDLTKTTDSAKNLAAGFYQIQSSGFTGADGMMVLEASTKAATAGLTSTEVSAKAILAALNAYGMEAEDASHISDVLFKTVDLGVISFDELAGQIGDVMGTSSMTGIKIEEVGAAISQMTRKGISGSESVTALNQLLLQFVSPSSKMIEKAAAMGVELNVATLRSKGLAGALQEIVEKGGGSDALLNLFGDNVRALKGALALGGEGLGEFNDMLGEFDDVTGRTAEAFAVQTQSFAAQWKNLQNIGTAALIELGNVLVPVLLDLAKGLLPMIAALKNANPEWVKWTLVLGGVLAAAGPVLTVLGTLLTVVGSLMTPVGILVGIVVALGAAWVYSQGGLDKALGTLQALASTVADMVMPRLNELWAWFATEVIPAVLTFRDEVMGAMRTAFDWVTAVGLPKLRELQTWFEADIVPAVINFKDQVLGAMLGVSDWITATGLPKLNELKAWFETDVLPAVTTFKDNALNAVKGISDWITNTGLPKLREFSEALAMKISGGETNNPLQAILGKVQEFANWVNTNWPNAKAVILTVGEVLKDVFSAALETVGSALERARPLFDGIVTGFEKGNPYFKAGADLWGALGELLKALQPLFSILATLIGGALLLALGVLVGALTGVARALQAMAPWILYAVVAVVTFVTDVVRLITDFFNVFNALFSGNLDEAIRYAQAFVADVVRIFIDIGLALLSVVGGALAGIVGLVIGFVEGVIGFFVNLYDELVGHSIVPDMMEDIFDAVAGGLGDVVKVVGTKLAETGKAMLDGATAMAQDWGRKWGEMKSGLETRWTEMGQVVSTKAGEVWLTLKTTLENLKAEWDAKWDGLVGKVKEIWEGIQSALDVETLRDNFLVAATSLAEVGMAMVSNIEAGFKESMKTLWATLTAAFDVEGLTTELGKTLAGFVDFGKVIVDNLIAGFVAAKTTLVDALTGLLSEALTGLFGVSTLTDLIGKLVGGGGSAFNPIAQPMLVGASASSAGGSTSAGRGAQTVITDNRVYNITVNDRAAMALFLETQRREQVRLAEGLM